MSTTEVEAAASEHDKHVKVTLVWGGTGESKEAEVGVDDTAEQVFNLIFQRFHQQKSDKDTFEVNGKDFPRSRFGETVKSLIEHFGKELVFEVIPPTSGA
jgi:hypothetical protein